MPFKKGQSGNPKGRPSHRKEFVARFAHYANHTLAELNALDKDPDKKKKLTVFDAIVIGCAVQACTDDAARKTFLERLLHRPPQALIGDDDEPAIKQTITYRFMRDDE
jgi:tellurite resistance protein